MAGKKARELRANIVLGARKDSSLSIIGRSIEELSAQVSGFSNWLIDVGKTGITTYAEYEKLLKETETAFNAVYSQASKASQAVRELDKQAMEWANNSVFTTSDIAEGIAQMAHAGWDYEKILAAMPKAINLAIAGNMTLSETVDDMVKVVNAAGIPFDNLDTLIDTWAYGANRSATSIAEMGDAFRKMGASMGFFDGDIAGIVASLGILADNGTVGTEAGTMLRSAIIRLIAPTVKATDAMEALGFAEDEIADVLGDSSYADAAEELNKLGFSAYDSQGNLKNIVDLFTELDALTKNLSDEKRNKILSSIFPTRTLSAAMALMKDGALNDSYKDILAFSDGYSDLARTIMQSGLSYSLEHFDSVIDVFRTRVGGALKDDVSWVTDFLSTIMESINGMDDGAFKAIVSGMEAFAILGPGLAITGKALKYLGGAISSGPWGVGFLIGAGLIAAAKGIYEYKEAVYESSFGDLTLNTEEITQSAMKIAAAFDERSAGIKNYNTELQTALSNYQSLTSTFSENLATKVVTGAELTPENQAELFSLGDEISRWVTAGLESDYSALAEEAMMLLNVTPDMEADEISRGIFGLIVAGYDQAIVDAEKKSNELRGAMTAAFQDGKINADEYRKIISYCSSFNQTLAMAMSKDDWVDSQIALEKAQALGLAGLTDSTQIYKDIRDKQLQEASEAYYSAIWDISNLFENFKGTFVSTGDGEQILIDQEWKDKALEMLKEGYQGTQTDIETSFNDSILRAYILAGSGAPGFKDQWAEMEGLANLYAERGGFLTYEDINQYEKDFATAGQYALGRFLDETIEAMGGEGAMTRAYERYRQLADEERAKQDQADEEIIQAYEEAADQYKKILWMNALFDTLEQQVQNYESTGNTSYIQSVSGGDLIGLEQWAGTAEKIRSEYENLGEESKEQAEYLLELIGNALENGYADDTLTQYLENPTAMNLSGTEWLFNAYERLSQSGQLRDVSSDWDKKFQEGVSQLVSLYATIFSEQYDQVYQEYVDAAEAKEAELLKRSSAFAGMFTLAMAKGSDIYERLPDWARALFSKEENPQTEIEIVADTKGADKALDKLAHDHAEIVIKPVIGGESVGTPGTSTSVGAIGGGGGGIQDFWNTFSNMSLFADGGYADEPSIFGEAGPEWAIPEEHSLNTASLLNAAREQSGFTWPEIMSLTGSGGTERTLVYSPTIIVRDATGVEQKLIEDKRRLEEWLKYHELRKSVEVYQ